MHKYHHACENTILVDSELSIQLYILLYVSVQDPGERVVGIGRLLVG